MKPLKILPIATVVNGLKILFKEGKLLRFVNGGSYELFLYVGTADWVNAVRVMAIGLAEFFDPWGPSIRIIGWVITMIFHARRNVGFIVISLELVIGVMDDDPIIKLRIVVSFSFRNES